MRKLLLKSPFPADQFLQSGSQHEKNFILNCKFKSLNNIKYTLEAFVTNLHLGLHADNLDLTTS